MCTDLKLARESYCTFYKQIMCHYVFVFFLQKETKKGNKRRKKSNDGDSQTKKRRRIIVMDSDSDSSEGRLLFIFCELNRFDFPFFKIIFGKILVIYPNEIFWRYSKTTFSIFIVCQFFYQHYSLY